MRLKQSQEEFDRSAVEVEKRLLPSKLKATPGNAQLILAWMVKNCMEGDLLDASVKNQISAIVALDKAGLVEWEILPVKKPAKPQPEYLQTHDGARQNQPKDAELNIAMAQEKKRREHLGDVENGKIMAEAAALVRNHSAYPHSRAIRERTELKKELDRLLAAKVHPKEVLSAVKAKQNTFSGADITRPKIAG